MFVVSRTSARPSKMVTVQPSIHCFNDLEFFSGSSIGQIELPATKKKGGPQHVGGVRVM